MSKEWSLNPEAIPTGISYSETLLDRDLGDHAWSLEQIWHRYGMSGGPCLDTGMRKVMVLTYTFHGHFSMSLSLISPLILTIQWWNLCSFLPRCRQHPTVQTHVCMASIISLHSCFSLLQMSSYYQRFVQVTREFCANQLCLNLPPEDISVQKHLPPCPQGQHRSWVLTCLAQTEASSLRYRFKLHIHSQRSSDHLNGLIDASSSLNQSKQQGYQQGCGQQGWDSSC